jgi:hypothetical protein
MKATSQPVKTTNSYEAVEPTDVERDMLNDDEGSKADSNHDILTLEKDQHVLTKIKICWRTIMLPSLTIIKLVLYHRSRFFEFYLDTFSAK